MGFLGVLIIPLEIMPNCLGFLGILENLWESCKFPENPGNPENPHGMLQTLINSLVILMIFLES